MSDRDKLLAAIYAKPDDDGARTVYADALLERGDVRGELIVAQLQGNTSRARSLLRTHAQAWPGPFAPIALTFEFERGFPAKLAIDVDRIAQIRAIAKDPAWSTILLVELGGGTGRRLSIQKKAAIRALGRTPGFTHREFRPSLANILEGERIAKLPR